MAANKNILFVVSSHDQFLDGKPTGYYLPEAAHPYYVLKNAGYKIDVASPKGGKAPLDPSSVEAFKEDSDSIKFLNEDEPKQLFANTKKDLTTDKDSIALIESFLKAGKPVASVCHGPTVFLNVTDPKSGEPFVKGKKITCFSDDEERQAGLVDSIPFLVETELRNKGADFQLTRKAWAEEVVVDGQLITAGNPASASGMAKALLTVLEKA
ncbi:hypothetical protein JCM3775_001539 [Rhodotorula graminis]